MAVANPISIAVRTSGSASEPQRCGLRRPAQGLPSLSWQTAWSGWASTINAAGSIGSVLALGAGGRGRLQVRFLPLRLVFRLLLLWRRQRRQVFLLERPCRGRLASP